MATKAGAAGVLLDMKGKLTIEKLKSSLLSYNLVESVLSPRIFMYRSVSLVPFLSSVIVLLLTVYILPTSGFVFNIRSSPDPNRNRCGLRWIKMTIHPPIMYASRCQSATVYTLGCKGGCESYSKIDYERNATNIQRYCSCCSQTEVAPIRKPALLPCSDGNVLRIPVKMALTCHCRPCSMSVQQIDIFDLRRLLASSRPSSAIFGG